MLTFTEGKSVETLDLAGAYKKDDFLLSGGGVGLAVKFG